MNRDVTPSSSDEPTEIVRNTDSTIPSPAAPTVRYSAQRKNGSPSSSTAQANPPRDIYQEAFRALRGRYWHAIAFGLIGALIGSGLAYHLVKPRYRSEGWMRIAYTRPVVMQETDQNGPMAMFDSFLLEQIKIIHSQDLLEKAMKTRAWEATGIAPSSAVLSDLFDNLTVEHPGNSDHLRVMYEDTDPAIAAAAVNAVIEAYSQTYESRDQSTYEKRMSVLVADQENYQKSLIELRAKLAAASEDGGSSDLEARYTGAIQRRNMLGTLLANVAVALELKPLSGPTTTPSRDATSVEHIALNDSTMRDFLRERERIEDAMEEGRQRNKWGDNHPEMLEMKRKLASVNSKIDKYAGDYGDLQRQIQDMTGLVQNPASGAAQPANANTLELQQKVITKLYDLTQKEVIALGTKRQEVIQLTGDAAKLTEQLDSVNRRIRTLQVESGFGSRLSIVNGGEIPLRPFYNPRKKYMLMGAGIGALIPIGLLVLFGLASGKFRFVHETEDRVARTTPLLGMLPSLPEKLKDYKLAADAAHAVHQIRVMLQTNQQSKGRSVYMVTSATSGEGKTNLTVALGLSFAASGCRTLVIDCDLVGQGVTRGFRAERTTGLREALDSGSARGFVKKLPQGLRLLTAGNADTVSGWTLSSTATHRMLSEVRRYYDIVLIDTGPILGSVEAAILAPAVDGVILTISRGQQRNLVDRAMNHLASLGADPVGFVFNRSQNSDFRYTSYHSSARSHTSSSTLPELRDQDTSEVAAFGPLVRSVASFMRMSEGTVES